MRTRGSLKRAQVGAVLQKLYSKAGLKIHVLLEAQTLKGTPSQDCGWFALFTSQGAVKISSVCSET